jgi:peptidoglycan hydrolase CwlO-like protein
MSNDMLTLLLSLLGTSIGTVGGILASSKLTNFRLQQLEDQVKKHNNIVERTYIAEKDIKEIREDVKELKSDIKDADSKLYSIDSRVSKLETERG